ncbi:MAG: CotH kinase family protein [Limisphaerales bacterium]
MAAREMTPRVLVRWLIIGTVVCIVALVVLVAGLVHWFSTMRAHQQVEVRNRAEGQIILAQNTVAQRPLEIPKNFTKNAISGVKTNVSPAAGDNLFTDLVIPRLQITLDSGELSKLRRSPREYVVSTIKEGDKIYTNVAIRMKGGPGSYRELQDQPSFTVNFDEFAPGQKFHGLKKVHLNSSVQDGSLLEEKISRELFDAANVPAPRAGHAHVTFNKRNLGLYVLIEGVNKQFLKRYFKDAEGNVYDGHSGSEVDQKTMETNSGDNRRDQSRRLALAAAAREPDLSLRRLALEETLDVDRFLTFMAMEMILWHWDGYTMHRNNFRIFHDRSTDRMVFFPQGMDQMLNNTDRSVMPQAAGLVARSVLEVPELRERYRARVAEIATNVFDPDRIASRIYEVSTAVQATLAETNPNAAAAHPQQADSLRRRVRSRAAYLQRFVSPPAPVKFDELGIATLSNWQPRRDLGEAILDQERDDRSNTLLHIATTSGCTASWRALAKLPPGDYQLEASIKTKGVVLYDGDLRSGAGLRISRHREGQKNAGDMDWTPISFEFEVTAEKTETELICELRAEQGEVWFDLSSIKLKRL